MIEKLRGEKGASSVMVVLLLVALLVFGIAALTTALSSARLGQKVSEWNTAYYAAEAQANERLAEIDKAVNEARLSAYGFETALESGLGSLGFKTCVEKKDGRLLIGYEAKSGGIAIDVVLSASATDGLKILQWKERQ